MNAEGAASLVNRIASLEDIIRQQEHTLTVLLSRLRDVEQFVGNESRNRDQAQQQLNALLGDRSGVAELSDKLNVLLSHQNDRISALQAESQGTRASLQGIDQKFDATFRGIEQKLQGDLTACYERIKAGEGSTAEAVRSLQSNIQSQNAAIQSVDAQCRDAVQTVQQILSGEVTAVRQRVEVLESSTRDALRDVHGSLSNEIRETQANLEGKLQSTAQAQNQSLQTLDQRVRGEMAAMHQQKQMDIDALRQRLDDGAGTLQAAIVANHTNLSGEIAGVVQHVQEVDARQKAAHQNIVQELAKHDHQMESIDVSWRGSVMDLNGKTQEDINGVRESIRSATQSLQVQITTTQDRFSAQVDKVNENLNDLARSMQERCLTPLDAVRIEVHKHAERIGTVQTDTSDIREYVKGFALEVDRNATQFRNIMEAAVRASHTDLLDRINVVSAATALRQDPEQVYNQINAGLLKLWNDVSGTFVTQRELNGLQSQLAMLESAVRVEVCDLAEKDNAIHKRLDKVEVSQRTTAALAQDAATAAANNSIHSYPAATRQPLGGAVTTVNSSSSPSHRLGTAEYHPINDNNNAFSTTGRDKRANSLSLVPFQSQSISQSHSPALESRQNSPGVDRRKSSFSTTPASLAATHNNNNSANARDRAPSVSVGTVELRQDLAAPADAPTYFVSVDGPADEEGGDGRHGSTTELIPSQHFVRKKEYSNFKSFAKAEIDSLWSEVMDLKRNKGLSRSEVDKMLAENKASVLHAVFDVVQQQENELIGMLGGIKLQISNLIQHPELLMDTKIVPVDSNGTVRFDQLAYNYMQPRGSITTAPPQLFQGTARPHYAGNNNKDPTAMYPVPYPVVRDTNNYYTEQPPYTVQHYGPHPRSAPSSAPPPNRLDNRYWPAEEHKKKKSKPKYHLHPLDSKPAPKAPQSDRRTVHNHVVDAMGSSMTSSSSDDEHTGKSNNENKKPKNSVPQKKEELRRSPQRKSASPPKQRRDSPQSPVSANGVPLRVVPSKNSVVVGTFLGPDSTQPQPQPSSEHPYSGGNDVDTTENCPKHGNVESPTEKK